MEENGSGFTVGFVIRWVCFGDTGHLTRLHELQFISDTIAQPPGQFGSLAPTGTHPQACQPIVFQIFHVSWEISLTIVGVFGFVSREVLSPLDVITFSSRSSTASTEPQSLEFTTRKHERRYCNCTFCQFLLSDWFRMWWTFLFTGGYLSGRLWR